MASEAIRRTTYGNQGQEKQQQPGLLLSQANVERLVDKLSKMRGAALKLGQFLSIQGKPSLFLSSQLSPFLSGANLDGGYIVCRYEIVVTSTRERSAQGSEQCELYAGMANRGKVFFPLHPPFLPLFSFFSPSL